MPLVDEELPLQLLLSSVRLPKSIAFPSDAIVKYSILSVTLESGGGSPPAANPRTEDEKAAGSLGSFVNSPK